MTVTFPPVPSWAGQLLEVAPELFMPTIEEQKDSFLVGALAPEAVSRWEKECCGDSAEGAHCCCTFDEVPARDCPRWRSAEGPTKRPTTARATSRTHAVTAPTSRSECRKHTENSTRAIHRRDSRAGQSSSRLYRCVTYPTSTPAAIRACRAHRPCSIDRIPAAVSADHRQPNSPRVVGKSVDFTEGHSRIHMSRIRTPWSNFGQRTGLAEYATILSAPPRDRHCQLT